ncbi:hypothetical protein QR680_001544 [Steinernema hermaphroditum]|uniref:D-isomer specific 2-hydroxyacid dehydrogenase NAD-binding domain-containing protein n=1 Tax=Steinernema hermaphroditum TaxID=289476 RepID=A0AA39LG94_9BILA|nr:hypothetical protein QR680_001544 [Steinernema hermaphroditum]
MASTIETATNADTSLLLSSLYGAMVKPAESDQSATSSPPSTSSPVVVPNGRVKTNFLPCKPQFAPSGYGRMVLIYDSVSHPGHRREFAYKTQFTNMSGSTTVYYRCMACRALRHRLQRTMSPDELPAVPCIAVKNDQLMNDPDYPEANNHFCTPPTIEESMARQRNGYAKLMRKLRAQKGREDVPGKGGLPPFEAVESANLLLQQIQSNLYAAGEDAGSVKIEPESDVEQGEQVAVMDVSVSANARLEALVKLEEDRHHKMNGSGVEENNNQKETSPVAAAIVQSPVLGASVLSNKVSELWRALSRPKGVSTHIKDIVDKFIVNNWDLPENVDNYRNIAELACTSILSLARQVPQAAADVRAGNWNGQDFKSEEVFGKTLAVVGLGRIGLEVASRMAAFGMTVIGYDVFVSPEAVAKRGIRWTPLEEIWPQADYITVHVPLIPQTANMINREVLAKCKKGVKIVNVARGGIVNEVDLVESLNAGHAGGAAFDVFEQEPPTYRELVDHPKVICTPHLGASTIEAQQRVANEIAENIVALNQGTGLFGALNASAVAAVLDEAKAEFVKTAIALSRIVASLAANPKNVVVRFPSAASGLNQALIAGTVVGLLQAKGSAGLNLINAELNAKKEGIQVTVEPSKTGELSVSAGAISISGYPSPSGAIISSINDNKVPVPVVATGTIALSVGQSAGSIDTLKDKLLTQCGLIGSGHIAVFGSLDPQELEELSKRYSVIQF